MAKLSRKAIEKLICQHTEESMYHAREVKRYEIMLARKTAKKK